MNEFLLQMNSVAMDALKYSGYMGSLYSSASSDQAAIKSMYSSPESQTSLSSSGDRLCQKNFLGVPM